jgi:hypothetical protein
MLERYRVSRSQGKRGEQIVYFNGKGEGSSS